jgi:hypothetical protein
VKIFENGRPEDEDETYVHGDQIHKLIVAEGDRTEQNRGSFISPNLDRIRSTKACKWKPFHSVPYLVRGEAP